MRDDDDVVVRVVGDSSGAGSGQLVSSTEKGGPDMQGANDADAAAALPPPPTSSLLFEWFDTDALRIVDVPSFLKPEGCWVSGNLFNDMFSPCYAHLKPATMRFFVILELVKSASVSVFVVPAIQDTKLCQPFFILLALMLVFTSVAVIAVRPYRHFLDGVMSVILSGITASISLGNAFPQWGVPKKSLFEAILGLAVFNILLAAAHVGYERILHRANERVKRTRQRLLLDKEPTAVPSSSSTMDTDDNENSGVGGANPSTKGESAPSTGEHHNDDVVVTSSGSSPTATAVAGGAGGTTSGQKAEETVTDRSPAFRSTTFPRGTHSSSV